MRRASRFSPKQPLARAFSLIEIVLTVGIISFALVGILGLFPVAVEAAANSQRETQAALIARSIYTDLDSRPDARRFLFASTNSLESGPESAGEELDITKQGNYYLAYDNDGLPLGLIDKETYSHGKKEAAYLARVKIRPGAGNSSDAQIPELTRVEVSVEAPASAREARRKKIDFVSLCRQGISLTSAP